MDNPHVKKQIIVKNGKGDVTDLKPIIDSANKAMEVVERVASISTIDRVILELELKPVPKDYQVVVGDTGYLDNFDRFQEGYGEDEYGRKFVNIKCGKYELRLWQRYTGNTYPIIIGTNGICRVPSASDIEQLLHHINPLKNQ